jgi:hypothetical protein
MVSLTILFKDLISQLSVFLIKHQAVSLLLVYYQVQNA